MLKYIIKWNTGYGDEFEEIEAEDDESALEYAYDYWRENAESSASYSVVGEASDELRKRHGLDT